MNRGYQIILNSPSGEHQYIFTFGHSLALVEEYMNKKLVNHYSENTADVMALVSTLISGDEAYRE